MGFDNVRITRDESFNVSDMAAGKPDMPLSSPKESTIPIAHVFSQIEGNNELTDQPCSHQVAMVVNTGE